MGWSLENNQLAVLYDAAIEILVASSRPRETATRVIGLLMISALDNVVGLGLPAGATVRWRAASSGRCFTRRTGSLLSPTRFARYANRAGVFVGTRDA